MPEFLELMPPEEALVVWLRAMPEPRIGVERIPSAQALGRVTAEAVRSPEALPGFARSTVDGYAVQARSTHGASDTLPAYLELVGEVPMGAAPGFSVGLGQAAVIHTGGMLPQGADSVVMLELTQTARAGEIEIFKAVAAGENVLKAGEDVGMGEEVLGRGVRLDAAAIGGLMALGLTEVAAARKPVAAILSSGDEVVPPDRAVQPGQVRDVNSYALAALVESCGGEARVYGIVPDRAEALRAALRRALGEADFVVITAGSSASARDLTAAVIRESGAPGVLVHGVNVRPGKPTILGVCDGKPVVGLPGNPVSALVIARLFVRPLVARLLGAAPGKPEAAVPARLSLNLASQAGREDWVPVRLRREGQGWAAEPIFYKSNLIFSLAHADGLVRIPPDATGLEVGAAVEVVLL